MRACPRCGNPVTNTCYHEGDDVRSVEMSVEDAVELVRGEIEDIEGDLEGRKESLKYLLQDTLPAKDWLKSNGFTYRNNGGFVGWCWVSGPLTLYGEVILIGDHEVPKKATIGNIKRVMEAIT